MHRWLKTFISVILLCAVSSISYSGGIDEDLSVCHDLLSSIDENALVVTQDSIGLRAGRYFVSHYPGLMPGCVEADLDGNDLSDVVLLYLNEGSEESNMAIFMQTQSSRYELKKNIPTNYESAYLKHIDKEYIQEKFNLNFVDNQGKDINNIDVAVELVFYGKSSKAYYWDKFKGDIDFFQVSD